MLDNGLLPAADGRVAPFCGSSLGTVVNRVVMGCGSWLALVPFAGSIASAHRKCICVCDYVFINVGCC